MTPPQPIAESEHSGDCSIYRYGCKICDCGALRRAARSGDESRTEAWAMHLAALETRHSIVTANTKEIAERCADAWFSPREKFADEHFPGTLISEEDRKIARAELVHKILPAITKAFEGKEREVEQLKLCLEPGKASAIVNGMFKLAEEFGHPGGSSIHALTYLRRLIEQINQQLTAERERTDKLEEALGIDQAWPLSDVLLKLCEASDHLLKHHDCDSHGHEGITLTVEYGRKYAVMIQQALAPEKG